MYISFFDILLQICVSSVRFFRTSLLTTGIGRRRYRLFKVLALDTRGRALPFLGSSSLHLWLLQRCMVLSWRLYFFVLERNDLRDALPPGIPSVSDSRRRLSYRASRRRRLAAPSRKLPPPPFSGILVGFFSWILSAFRR